MQKKKIALKLLSTALAASLVMSFPAAAFADVETQPADKPAAEPALVTDDTEKDAEAPEAAVAAKDNEAVEADAEKAAAEEPKASVDGKKTEARLQNPKVTAFVERLYTLVLNRVAENDGLNDQCDALLNGATAGEIAFNFFKSKEFSKRGLSNEEQVEIAYQVMLDRASDKAGKKDWVSKLESGCSIGAVIAGFVESAEFTALCKTWGLTRGSADTLRKSPEMEARDRNVKITGFVNRLYRLVMDRAPEAKGINDQAQGLLNGMTAGQIAMNFFQAKEFKNRTLSNADRVEIVYQVMLDRASDAKGKADWLEILDMGCSVGAVVAGFVESPEFTALCKKWGVSRGDAAELRKSLPVRDRNLKVTKFVDGLYKNALGRTGDASGLNSFVGDLVSYRPASEVVVTFFTSAEFKARKLSNEEIVKAAYRALFGREADANGLKTWKSALDNGSSVKTVIKELTATTEFSKYIEKFGLYANPGAAIAYNKIRNMSSPTKHMLALYLDNYTCYAYTGSAGNWKLVREFKCGVGKGNLGYDDYSPTFRGTWPLATGPSGWDWDADGLTGPRCYEPRGWGVKWFSSTFGCQGFHSTIGVMNDPDQVGKKVSHGCIRCYPDDAKYVYDVPAGTSVHIWGTIYDK